MPNTITAGTSIINISPKPGIALAGYPHYPRYNEGVHDPLFAGCIYFTDGHAQLMIIAADLTNLCKAYASRIRENISKESGIPRKDILICVTHTHSAPNTSPTFEEEIYPYESYVEEITNKITQSALEAFDNSFEAAVGAAKTCCGKEKGVGGNRRQQGGIADPEIEILAVKDVNEKGISPKVCLVSYALHPSVLHHDSKLVTADFPGYIRSYLKETYPDMNFLFLQGASGNQSTRYFRTGQTFPEAERIGSALGEEIRAALEKMDYSEMEGPLLSAAEEEIDILLREIPGTTELDQNIKKAKKELEEKRKAGARYIDLQNADLKVLGFEDLRFWADKKERGEPLPFCDPEKPLELKAVSIGKSICLFFTQTEMFVEYQLELKKKAPFTHLLLATMVNGSPPGYICTPETYEEGGYESGASLYRPEMGEYFLSESLKLIDAVKSP